MREAAADTAGAVRGFFFFPILIDCAGNTKGGASSPKGGKRVTARPEVPPLFPALICHHALRQMFSLVRTPVRRSARHRASCLPRGGREETMSGRGAVGSRERPRLARYPAVPASFLGCRCQARGASHFHSLALRVGLAELGRKSIPGGPGSTRRFLHPGSRLHWISPGPGLSELPLASAARRPPPLSPRAAAAVAAATEQTGPAP